MDTATVIANLEREWDFSTGFFGRIRRGEFETESLNRLIGVLGQIELQHNTVLNRRLVSLIWYMPLFLVWQKERVQEVGGDIAEFEKATNQVLNLVEGLLGVP